MVWTVRCDELLLVVVTLRLSVVSRGQTIGVLATKGIPLWIAADREKGRASWRQAGLPAQLCGAIVSDVLCVRSYVQFVCVCVYMCLCVCVRT